MSKIAIIRSIISEYGFSWAVSRTIYDAKLKTLSVIGATEKFYEKKAPYPVRVDIFEINNKQLASFIGELEEADKTELIHIADNACNGVIKGFSSIELDYGNPIDWQMNPLTGVRCNDNTKWYRIADFDKKRGDIKVVWEASRFSHFIALARAFLLTNDAKYYVAFSEQLKSWLTSNKYSYGANFKCGQECSIRMVNTLLAYTVFKKAGISTDADESNAKDLIDRCYRKVLSNFSYAYKCIKNNHTISELMGMIVGAWCCEDYVRLNKAYKLLDEVIDEQFTDDGGYKQFSFNYQRLALQDIEIILAIESKTEKRINERSRRRIEKAVELMYQCQDDTGDMPNYGSNDGALVYPVTSCGYRDFRPVINTIYALITGKQLYEAGKHQEELIWFSLGREIDSYSTEQLVREPQHYQKAGLFTFRSKNSWAMIVSNNYRSRPAHMDQLHFDLWINGINVFCDAGTYSYASDIGRKMIENESHNTAQVKKAPQMSLNGPFMVINWTRRKLGKTDQAVFEGEIYTKTGYTHKRLVHLDKNVYVISDTVDNDAYILFHTPCDVEIEENVTRILHNNKLLCELKTEEAGELRESKRSLYYLRDEKTITIAIKAYANKELKTIIEIKGDTEND